MHTSLYILDDDLYYGRCLKKQLESTVDEVKHFKTERNFRKALQSPPNIIILDYNLEQSTGLDVIDEIQELGLSSELLLVSSQDNVNVVLNAHKKGVLGYFEKSTATFCDVQKCIEWMLLMSNDFHYPLNRNQFREMWLKSRKKYGFA
ncbi:response regulator [Crocinitomicaceae bacterium]|nr:response regulator [Crocinitomicaceae bacterium]